MTNLIVLRSMLTSRSMLGRWTLTATCWPVAASTALCTWPSEAAAVASGSSELNSALTRLVQLRLDHRHDVAERRRRHFVLQRAEHVEGPLRQQIGARAEELAELDHQHAELDRRLAERDQHVDEQLDVGLHVGVALLARAQDAAALAIDDPDRPQQQPRHAHEADRLGQPIDAQPLGPQVGCWARLRPSRWLDRGRRRNAGSHVHTSHYPVFCASNGAFLALYVVGGTYTPPAEIPSGRDVPESRTRHSVAMMIATREPSAPLVQCALLRCIVCHREFDFAFGETAVVLEAATRTSSRRGLPGGGQRVDVPRAGLRHVRLARNRAGPKCCRSGRPMAGRRCSRRRPQQRLPDSLVRFEPLQCWVLVEHSDGSWHKEGVLRDPDWNDEAGGAGPGGLAQR